MNMGFAVAHFNVACSKANAGKNLPVQVALNIYPVTATSAELGAEVSLELLLVTQVKVQPNRCCDDE